MGDQNVESALCCSPLSLADGFGASIEMDQFAGPMEHGLPFIFDGSGEAGRRYLSGSYAVEEFWRI